MYVGKSLVSRTTPRHTQNVTKVHMRGYKQTRNGRLQSTGMFFPFSYTQPFYALLSFPGKQMTCFHVNSTDWMLTTPNAYSKKKQLRDRVYFASFVHWGLTWSVREILLLWCFWLVVNEALSGCGLVGVVDAWWDEHSPSHRLISQG